MGLTMPRTNARPSVKNQREINALTPEHVEYRATVDGVDCLYVKVSPNGTKKYVTSLTVSKRIQLPKGQSRQKSKTHGLTSQFTLPEIKQIHYKYYERFKRGEDPREEAIRDTSDLERTSQLNRPIVELSLERLERRLARGDIGDGYNDRLYTRKVQDVIGNVSFQGFNQKHADQLSAAYPPHTQRSTAEKVKKLITKTYNSLPSDARVELRKDIPFFLNNAFGRIKPARRNHQVIEPEHISELWHKMLEADVNPIFKDAFVFLLLTGERKSATLKAKIEHVHYENDAPEWLYLDSKRDQTGAGMNLIHPIGMLALLLNRLIKQSEDAGSTYIFPSQKGNGCLTSIKPLVDSIGGVGPKDIRTNPHNLRRTTANLARIVLGSTQLAEEHILHFKSYMTGSTENYFLATAKSFAKKRSSTFRGVYRHLDDLILSSGTHMYLAIGSEDAEFVDELQRQNPDRKICREFISVGSRWLHFSNKDSPEQVGSFDDNEDFFENAYIWSPVASFCAGIDKYVKLSDRPLLQETIHLGWINYGDPVPRNLDDEIA